MLLNAKEKETESIIKTSESKYEEDINTKAVKIEKLGYELKDLN